MSRHHPRNAPPTHVHNWRGNNLPMVKPKHITKVRIAKRLLPVLYKGMETQEAVFLHDGMVTRGIILQVLPFKLRVWVHAMADPVFVGKRNVLAIDMVSDVVDPNSEESTKDAD